MARVAQTLALIAAGGEFAIRFGIVPWATGSATDAARRAFKGWMAGRGDGEPAETREAIVRMRLVLSQHGDSRFDKLDMKAGHPLTTVRDRLGWRRGEGEKREWLIPPEIWKEEIFKGLDPIRAAKTLANKEWLKRPSGERGLLVKETVNSERLRVYVVTGKIFSDED